MRYPTRSKYKVFLIVKYDTESESLIVFERSAIYDMDLRNI